MTFQSYNMNLRIIMDNPRQIVYPTGLAENKQGRWVQFKGGMLETEDQEEIDFLLKHRLYNQMPGTPGAFWTYIPPRNLEAELAAKEKELVEARRIIAEAEALKAKGKDAKPDAGSAPTK